MTLPAYNVPFVSWKSEMNASTVVLHSLRVNAHKQPIVCTFRRHTILNQYSFFDTTKKSIHAQASMRAAIVDCKLRVIKVSSNSRT